MALSSCSSSIALYSFVFCGVVSPLSSFHCLGSLVSSLVIFLFPSTLVFPCIPFEFLSSLYCNRDCLGSLECFSHGFQRFLFFRSSPTVIPFDDFALEQSNL